MNVGNVDEDSVSLLSEISVNMNSWTKLVQVQGIIISVMFKLDTGADISVVLSRLCKEATPVRTTQTLVGPVSHAYP